MYNSLTNFICKQSHAKVELIPSKDDSLAKAWVDLAYTAFDEDVSEDSILQIDGMIEFFSDKGRQEIVAWLERKANKIKFKANRSIQAE